jgi:putative Holliday junction resolvase
MKPVAALGLDIGRKRIGVAGCDRLGLSVTELTTLEGLPFAEIVTQLQTLVDARQVDILVVGLPYAMDGSLGKQARKVQGFAQRLSQALGLPIEYVDERLTSYQAEQMLWSAGKSPCAIKPSWTKKPPPSSCSSGSIRNRPHPPPRRLA